MNNNSKDKLNELKRKSAIHDNEKNDGSEIKMNPYDNLPLHRKIIDKKNSKIGLIDLGNHILIIGFILLVIFVAVNVD